MANEVSGAKARAVKVGPRAGRRAGRATLSKKLAVISGKRGGGGGGGLRQKKAGERVRRALLHVHGVTLLTRCLL